MPINSFLYPGAKVTTAYEVANSCRFDGSSAYMSRTHGTPTNAKKHTFSAWVKMNPEVSSHNFMFGVYDASSSDQNNYYWRSGSDDRLSNENSPGGSSAGGFYTTRKFRDPSAWYHIVVAEDTTQATDTNRVKVYVNGVQETVFDTMNYIAQNTDNIINTSGSTVYIGQRGGSYGWLDGYMAEVCFIDGTQYAASDFGEFDEDSPTIWKPKDVSSLTFGNNGFYLDFEDSSALGNDVSGNNNDFSVYNLAATDQATDTPTNNFATLNSLNNYWAAATFSEGNCVYTSNNTSDYFGYATSTIGVASGKWYFEAKLATESGQDILGITSRNMTGRTTWLGSRTQEYGYYEDGGEIRSNSADTAYGSAYDANDIIGIYMDLDNNLMYVAKNGTLENSGTGHSITAASSTDSGFYHLAVGDNSDSTNVWQVNFGGCSAFTISSGNADANGYGNFEYDPSSGTFDSASKDFLALCTKNLGSDGG